MTPTPKLRFVERFVPSKTEFGLIGSEKIRILQQWWEEDVADTQFPKGEWRDVPLEEET